MEILILHRVPYNRIEYHRGIDHTLHNVTYFGKKEILATLPATLRCRAVERPGIACAHDEATDWLAQNPQHFDHIISMSEYELLDAARLRDRLNIAGSSESQVMLARNKILMKKAVSDAGLSAPRYLSLWEFMASPERVTWAGKTVLKPHSGASSIDVMIFDTPQAAFITLAEQKTGVSALDNDSPDYANYEIEEFISGPVRHFDGLVQNGNVLAVTSSEYIGTCLDYMEHGLPLGSIQIPTSDAIRDWITQVLAAVSIRNGSFHLEAIMQEEHPVFLEVGNRVGGADVVAVFELATGIHLPSQELRIYLGEDVSADLPRFREGPRWYGWFVFPGHTHLSPTYLGIRGAKSFLHSAEIVNWHELPLGTPMPRNITYSAHEAPVTGIIQTASHSQSRQWINRLFSSASLRAQQDQSV